MCYLYILSYVSNGRKIKTCLTLTLQIGPSNIIIDWYATAVHKISNYALARKLCAKPIYDGEACINLLIDTVLQSVLLWTCVLYKQWHYYGYCLDHTRATSLYVDECQSYWCRPVTHLAAWWAEARLVITRPQKQYGLDWAVNSVIDLLSSPFPSFSHYIHTYAQSVYDDSSHTCITLWYMQWVGSTSWPQRTTMIVVRCTRPHLVVP